MHLENTLVMYGVYNAEILERQVKTVHALHSRQTDTSYFLYMKGQLKSFSSTLPKFYLSSDCQ